MGKKKPISETLPTDLTPTDVTALFSLPDDDDTMHQQPLRGVAPRREPQNDALVKIRSLRRAMRDAIDVLKRGADCETAIGILQNELEGDALRFLRGLGR